MRPAAFRSSAFVPALACAACLALSAVLLAGCAGSGQHQVIGASETCASCHSEEKPVFEGVEVPASAVRSDGSVTIKADAPSVTVCRPVFTAQDGSSYVPEESASASLVDGQAVVELDEGLWALCVDEGDAARARLVHVGAGNPEGAVVEL